MQASISLTDTPARQYLLRMADTCLILSQRLGEWCGHAPVLEEDIALTNIALDLLGQARALLALAGRSSGHDEDSLAFLRDERDYRNPTLVELPRGDFAFTVLRNLIVSTWLRLLWERLVQSSNVELAAIAGKAVKEARYHQQHSADWLVRLGDGTDESARRLRDACSTLWPYTTELFEADAVDAHAVASGLGPSWAELREPWWAELAPVLVEARLEVPAESPFRGHGKQGRHSEHMGYILAEMQHLQRSHPGAAW